MNYKHLRHLRHALSMVLRNRRTYAKLSVTVVLSFTLLLAYMALIDAQNYNRYAKVFSLPREVVQCYTYDDAGIIQTFISQVEDYVPDAQMYNYYSASTPLNAFDARLHAECFFLPNGVETVFSTDASSALDTSSARQFACVEPVALLGEKQNFSLEKNEAIINETFYDSLLAGGATEPLHIPISFYWKDGSCSIWEVEVVGICEDDPGLFIQEDPETGPIGCVAIYLSQEQLSVGQSGEFENLKHIAFVTSGNPETVMGIGRALSLVTQGIVEAQNEARTALRAAITSKAVTAMVMLALLAINLYSSFSNVLQTRNFEIGVKRAIGAPKSAVIRQFLYEALLVLGFDALLSAVLVADGLIIYKMYQKVFHSVTWLAYVSPYSIAIYSLSTIALTVSFSLLFAYKATQVEIVRYLKAES